ncbi:hypothetical protein Tco_1244888 [Tanacetum coccineum]
MAQMFTSPIEGYEDANLCHTINANNSELKQPLMQSLCKATNLRVDKIPTITLLRIFNKVTSKRLDIQKFRTLRLLRQCPHHGFSELHQLDTFYNSLNSNDQDALDSAAGGNFLDKMPQEGLAIIESKSKVRYSRSRANDSRVSTDAPLSISSPSNNSFDMQQIAASLEDKMTIKMNKMLNEMKALVVTTPAPVKAVEEVCVTCGSNHNFNLCPLTRSGNDFPVFHEQWKHTNNFNKLQRWEISLKEPTFKFGKSNETTGILKAQVKANEAVMKNGAKSKSRFAQNQMVNVTILLTSLMHQDNDFSNPKSSFKFNTYRAITIPNPKNEARAITTQAEFLSLRKPAIPMPLHLFNPMCRETSTIMSHLL